MTLLQNLRKQRLLIALSTVFLIIIFVPIAFLTSQKFSSYASAIQALGILIAIIIAVTTLRSDSRDRKVDRTLALHEELSTGSVGSARRRLGLHIREIGGLQNPITGVLITDFRDANGISTYSPPFNNESDPYTDAELIVRFFERCRMVLYSESIDELIFVKLIGRQAAWWDNAFSPDGTNARRALAEVSEWATAFAESHKERFPYFANWGNTRKYDFPEESVDQDGEQRPTPGF
jgi:hypothetical protein